MATRSDLRGFLKQSQKTSSSADARSPSYPLPNSDEIGRHNSLKEPPGDEMVKYMSKLPAYLQGEQSNVVLNVGVLDWSRLEQWKHGRRERSGKCESKVSSSTTTTTLGTLPNASQVHACSNLRKVKASRDLQHSLHGVRCTLDPELASSSSRDSLNKQEIATCSYKSSATRYQERVKNPAKSRRSHSSSGLLSRMGNSGGSLGAKETEKRAGEIHAQEQCTEKFDGEEEKMVRDSDAGLTSENHQVSNIVLLRSRKQSHMSSLDDNAKIAREEVNRCSLDFSSLELLRSEIPRSCPLSFDLERDSEDMQLPLLGVDLSAQKDRSGGKTSHSKTVSSRIFDQEKKRDHSPSKRFSFSFGRLSRSFTFKEEDSSAGQPSDDTINKSDSSMTFDGPSQSSNPEEKQNTHSGSRVGPLKRLLDPLLKPKVSENVLPSKARSSSENVLPSRTRALFQLTIRNGVPLFQFVVDDDNLKSRRSILGATMKSSASSVVKDDSVQYCTFYSVNEVVKKKRRGGSWLIHGHKDKQQQQQQHRFVYSVIGEMRLCNSDITTEQKSENTSSVIRESVLVDESEQRKEVAAVLIKKKKQPGEENGETTVIIPGGVHSIPEKGAPTPLISRWRSGGCCDCGGWDVGCKLHVLSNKTVLLHDHELDQTFKLFDQEEGSDKSSGPVLAMTELKTGIYRVEFGSLLSHLQAFFVCVTAVTCASEEETCASRTTGKSSSPFAPPLSPVGRA